MFIFGAPQAANMIDLLFSSGKRGGCGSMSSGHSAAIAWLLIETRGSGGSRTTCRGGCLSPHMDFLKLWYRPAWVSFRAGYEVFHEIGLSYRFKIMPGR